MGTYVTSGSRSTGVTDGIAARATHGIVTARPNRGTLAAIALLAAAALLPWLHKAAFPDEHVSLRSARLSWGALWQHSHVIDLVLLPYYSLLHLWILPSGSIAWARLLSLLAFGLTVYLSGRLGDRLGGRLCGVLAALWAATNPLLVAAALSARPYALSALAATAAAAAFVRWLDGAAVRWLWWFCLACLATMLLQLFAVLVPLSVLAAALALEPGRFRSECRSVIAPLGIVPAATLALALLAASQRGQIGWIPSLFTEKQLITALTGPASGDHSLYALFALAVAVAALAVCRRAWRLGFRRTRAELQILAIVAVWAALPTAILAAVSLAKPVFVDRYVTSSAPGLALTLALLGSRAIDLLDARALWLPAAQALGPSGAQALGPPTARWNDRSRALAGGAALGVTAVVVWFVCSVPAAEAVYRVGR